MRIRQATGRVTACRLAAVFLTAALACSASAAKLSVVVTTTLLQTAVADLGGGYVEVSTLAAPGSCPGHYDIRPQDVRKLAASRLVLAHGYEAYVGGLLRAVGKNKPKLVTIGVTGNWMVPDVYIAGAAKVCDALCAADPHNRSEYRSSFARLQARVRRLASELEKTLKAAGKSDVTVLCSDQQEHPVRWMGFKVLETYSRAEDFTPSKLHHLTSLGRTRKVRIVIDNLQSGPTAGRQLAKDIGAAHVTLSNFPGGYPHTGTWDACIKDNVRRVLAALKG